MQPGPVERLSGRLLQLYNAALWLPFIYSTCHQNKGASATYSLFLSLCFSAVEVFALGAASPAPAPVGAAPTSSGAPAAPADASLPASPAAAVETGQGKRKKLTKSD